VPPLITKSGSVSVSSTTAEFEFVLPDCRLVKADATSDNITDYLPKLLQLLETPPADVFVAIPRASSSEPLLWVSPSDALSSLPSRRFVIRGPPPPPDVVVVIVAEDGRDSLSIQASAGDPLARFFTKIKNRFPDADRLTLNGRVLDLSLPFIDFGISLSEHIRFSRNQGAIQSPSLDPEQFVAAVTSMQRAPDSPLIQGERSGQPVNVTFRYRLHDRRYLYRQFPAGSTIADATAYLRQQSDLAPFYLYLQSGQEMARDSALLTESEIVVYPALLLLVDIKRVGIWVFYGREARDIASVLHEYSEKFAVDAAALSIGYSSSPDPIPPDTLLHTLEYRPDDLLILRGPILRDYAFSFRKVIFPVSCRAEVPLLEAARLAGVIDQAGTENVVFRNATTLISLPGAGIGTYEPRRVVGVLECKDEAFLFRDALNTVYSLPVRTNATVGEVAQSIRATRAFARATAIQMRFRGREIASDRFLGTIGGFGSPDDFDVIASRRYNVVGGPDGLVIDLLDGQTVGQATSLLAQNGHEVAILSRDEVADPDTLMLAVQVDGVIHVKTLPKFATFRIRMPDGTTDTESIDSATTVADFLTANQMTGFTLFAGKTALSATDNLHAIPERAELTFRRRYSFASDLWEEVCVVEQPCHRRLSAAIGLLTDGSPEEYVAFLGTNKLDPTARLSSIPYNDGETIYLRRQREIVFRLEGTDRTILLICQDNTTVQQVKTALAPKLPDIRCRFELATATGRLNDADILLVTAPAGQDIIIRPTEVRRYSLVIDQTGERLVIDMDSFFKVHDLLTALKKHRTDVYVTDPNEPLDRDDRLSDVVPEGALLHLCERRLPVTVALESGTRVVRVVKHATFKILKSVLAGQLGVSDQELAVFVDGRELSDKDEEEPIATPNVAVRIASPRYFFKYPEGGRVQRNAVRIPKEKIVSEVIDYFQGKLGTTVSLWVGGDRLGQSVNLFSCGVGEQTIEVRLKDSEYLIRLPNVPEPVAVRLRHAETVGDFKAKLRVGANKPVEIGGTGLPIESHRLVVRCDGEQLADGVKFSEVGRTAGFDVLLDFVAIPLGGELVVAFSSLVNPQPLGGDHYVYEEPETGDRWVVSFARSEVQSGPSPYSDMPPELAPLVRIEHPCLLTVCRLQQAPGKIGPQYATSFTPGGSLEAVLASPPHWWNCTTMTIAIIGTLFGVRHVYARGLVHGGVRPDNIFFDGEMKPKVGAFGRGRDWTYLAPEVVTNTGGGEQADVFAFALVVFEILTGEKVFGQAKSVAELSVLHYGGNRPKFPEVLDPSIRELFENSLRADPEQRPVFDDFVVQLGEIGMLPIMDDRVDGDVIATYATQVMVWEQQQFS
jgi:hypothetical protein